MPRSQINPGQSTGKKPPRETRDPRDSELDASAGVLQIVFVAQNSRTIACPVFVQIDKTVAIPVDVCKPHGKGLAISGFRPADTTIRIPIDSLERFLVDSNRSVGRRAHRQQDEKHQTDFQDGTSIRT